MKDKVRILFNLESKMSDIQNYPLPFVTKQNISLWEGVVVLEGQYIYTSRENKTLETEYFWQTEREGGVYNIRLCGKTLFWSSLFQN